MGTLYFAAQKQDQYWVAETCPVRWQELGWLVRASVGSRGLIGAARERCVKDCEGPITVSTGTRTREPDPE